MASSSDLNDPQLVELEEKGQVYDQRLAMVRRYFHRECREVSKLQLQTDNERHMIVVLELKRRLLEATEELLKVEDQMESVPKIIKYHVLLSASFSATAAVLFNAPVVYGQLFAAMYLYVQMFLQLCDWINLMMNGMKSGELKHYAHLLSEIRAQARQ